MVRTSKHGQRPGSAPRSVAVLPWDWARPSRVPGLLWPKRRGRRPEDDVGVPGSARGVAGIVNQPRLPGAAWRERRALRAWYASAKLPLFGLPADWTGHRCQGQRAGRQVARRAGPFGLFMRPGGPLWVGALGLTHIDEDGGRLHVGSHRVTDDRVRDAMAANNLFRRLAWPLMEEFGREAFDRAVVAWRRQYRAGLLRWRWAVIPVGADAVRFRVLTVGTQWVALATIDDVGLQLDAQKFPIGRVRLVRITDARPYLSVGKI